MISIYIYTVICSITFEWFLDILGKCIMFSTQEKLESAVEKRRDILEKKFLREPKIMAANDEKNSASSAKPRFVENIQATEAVLPNSKACPMLGIRICEVKVVSMWNGLKWSKWKQCASQWPHNDFVDSCLMLDLNEYVDHCWSIEILKSPFVTLRCHRCSEFTFAVFAFWSKQVICLETYARLQARVTLSHSIREDVLIKSQSFVSTQHLLKGGLAFFFSTHWHASSQLVFSFLPFSGLRDRRSSACSPDKSSRGWGLWKKWWSPMKSGPSNLEVAWDSIHKMRTSG